MTTLFGSSALVFQILLHVIVLSVSLWILKQLLPRKKIGDYHKKYVLITGCDSGFGREIAIRLDEMGFYVFATCLTKAGEEFLAATCSERMKTLHLDVTVSESIQDAFNYVKDNVPTESGRYLLVNVR